MITKAKSKHTKHKKIAHDYEVQKQNHLEKLATSLLASQDKVVKFKSKVIKHLSFLSPEVSNYNSCNTLKLVDHNLEGFNTDIDGVLHVVSRIAKR